MENNVKNSAIVGIDFGTSNTTVSLISDNGFPQLLALGQNRTVIPTAVGWTGTDFVFAQEALNLKDDNKLVWLNLKRELGSNNKSYIVHNTKTDEDTKVTSQDLIIKYLDFLREECIKPALDGIPFEAVISTPAYFNQDQHAMLQNCFSMASYDVVGLISEPCSACILYAHDNLVQNETVLVFDIGGGTTDVALITSKDGTYSAQPTNGNSQLGGVDFDTLLVTRIINKLTIMQSKPDTKWVTNSFKRYLFEVVELAKKDLTKHSSTKIVVQNAIVNSNNQVKPFEYVLTREEFEKITKELVDKAISPIDACLKYNNIKKSDLKKVLMVGGASLTWGIKSRLIEMFPNAKIVLDNNAKFCVSKGNGLFGWYKKDFQKSVIIEKINKSIGVVAINPNNPKEPINKRTVVKIIHRGDEIPAYGSYTFRTSTTNQKDAKIELVQGEGHVYEDCAQIGTVILDNIGIATAGVNKITVELKVNDHGILTAYVSDSIKYKHQQQEIKLNTSWTTLDYIKLQKATKEEKQAIENEEIANNWVKYVKFYNKEWKRIQDLDESPALLMLKDILSDMKKNIKLYNWSKVDKLQREYINVTNDVIWEANENQQQSIKFLRRQHNKIVKLDNTVKQQAKIEAEVKNKPNLYEENEFLSDEKQTDLSPLKPKQTGPINEQKQEDNLNSNNNNSQQSSNQESPLSNGEPSSNSDNNDSTNNNEN